MSSNTDADLDLTNATISISGSLSADPFGPTVLVDENFGAFTTGILFGETLDGRSIAFSTFGDPLAPASLGFTASVDTTLDLDNSVRGTGELGILVGFQGLAAPVTSQAPTTVTIVQSGILSDVSFAPVVDVGGITSRADVNFLDFISFFDPPTAGLRQVTTVVEGGAPGVFNVPMSLFSRNGPLAAGTVTDVQVKVDPTATAVVDGSLVSLDEIFVLTSDEVPQRVEDYPSVAGLIDGFDFDPGRLLNVDGGTVTATGIDEDGFGGNDENVVRNIEIVVQSGAEVRTTDLRKPEYSRGNGDAGASVFPAIDVQGDGNTLRNAGLVLTERTLNEAVLLLGDEVAVENEGTIAATGLSGRAVVIEGDTGRILNTGTIATTDADSTAVTMEGPEVGEESFGGLDLTFRNEGEVLVDAEDTLGLLFDGRGASRVENAGRIEATGAAFSSAALIAREDVTTVNETGGVIASLGTLSPALVIGGSAMTLSNEGEIVSRGEGSAAVFASGPGLSIVNTETGRIAAEAEVTGAAVQVGGFSEADITLLPQPYRDVQDELERLATEGEIDLAIPLLRDPAQNAELRNEGLIEATTNLGGNFGFGIVAYLDDGTITNTATGTVRADATAVWLGGTATLVNDGLLESRRLDTDPDAIVSTVVVDRLGSDVTIDNREGGLIEGRITFLPQQGTILNAGEIGSIAAVESAFGTGAVGEGFNLTQTTTGTLGNDAEDLALIYGTTLEGSIATVTSAGAIVGETEILADTISVTLEESSTVSAAGDGAALDLLGRSTVAIAGDITAGRIGLRQGPSDFTPTGSSSLDLTIAPTGSIAAAGDRASAVLALFDGPATISNAGDLAATGFRAAGVVAWDSEAVNTHAISTSGSIVVTGDTASAVVTTGATLTNGGLVQATGTNARGLDLGPVVAVSNSGTIEISPDGRAAIWADAAFAQLLGGSGAVGLSVTNTGTISAGRSDGVAIQGELLGFGGTDRIVNGGEILGQVLLTEDNDTYVQNGGTVDGRVDGGTGDDVIELASGEIDGGLFENFETLRVAGTGSLTDTLSAEAVVEGGGDLTLAGTLEGDARVSASGNLTLRGEIAGSATVDVAGRATIEGGRVAALLEINGFGDVVGTASAALTQLDSGILTLTGSLSSPIISDGFSVISGPGGAISGMVTVGGGTLAIEAPVAISGSLASNGQLILAGGSMSAGTLLVDSGLTTLSSGVFTTSSTLVSGVLAVNGTLVSPTVTVISGASLVGTGTVVGNVVAAPGSIVEPGLSPGTLSIDGDLTVGGELIIEVDGVEPGQFDLVEVTGVADFSAATIRFELGAGVAPEDLGGLQIVSATNIQGLDTAVAVIPGQDGPAPILNADGSISVPSSNTAPTAMDDTGRTDEDTPLTLDLLVNDVDADGEALSIQSLGMPAIGTVVQNSNGTVTYTPDANANGPDSFTYVIADPMGATSTGTVSITVDPVNDAPVAAADAFVLAEGDGASGNVLADNGSGPDFDPDTGDLLQIVSVQGGAGIGLPVATDAGGLVTIAANGSFVYDQNGSFDGLGEGETAVDGFSYTISDGALTESARVTFEIAGANRPPVAVDDLFQTDEDTAVTGNVLFNDADADGDALAAVLVSDPANGNVALSFDGRFDYVPDGDFSGTDSFTYRVNDGRTLSDPAVVVIGVRSINDAPVARDDSARTEAGTPVSGDVSVNDADVDGDTLEYTLVSGPSGGQLDLAADGRFTYIPDPGFSGADSFIYAASDGSLEDTATVSLDVTPGEPEPGAGFAFSLVETGSRNLIAPILAGETVDPGDVSAFSRGIAAKWTGEGDTESVVLSLYNADGVRIAKATENFEPYALFGDVLGFYRDPSVPLVAGTYSLEATAYSRNGGRGDELGTTLLDFDIGPLEPSTDAFEFILVDTARDMEIGHITDGQTVDPGLVGADTLGIAVDLDGARSMKLALFAEDGTLIRQATERVEPFALFGDRRGDFRDPGTPLEDGTYTLAVSAYANRFASGPEFAAASVTFMIGDDILLL